MNFMNNGYLRAVCFKGSHQTLQIYVFLHVLVVNTPYFSPGCVLKHGNAESIIIAFMLGEGQLL